MKIAPVLLVLVAGCGAMSELPIPADEQEAAEDAGPICVAPACTAEADCAAWGASCCTAPSFAICVGNTAEPGTTACGCDGSMPGP